MALFYALSGDCHGRHPASKERLLKQDAFPRKDTPSCHCERSPQLVTANEAWQSQKLNGKKEHIVEIATVAGMQSTHAASG